MYNLLPFIWKKHICDLFFFLLELYILWVGTLPERPYKDGKTREHLFMCAVVFIFPMWSAGQVGDCVYRRQIWHRGVVNNVASSSLRLHL